MSPDSDHDRYQYHRLNAEDVPLLRELASLFSEAFEDPETYLAEKPSDAYLGDLLSSREFIAVVALADDVVVGGLTAYELRKFERQRSEIYIYDLAVQKSHRRRGVARALIGALSPIAVERGAWVAFVQADAGDAPAIALYSSLGEREDVHHFDVLTLET
ncbi:MAG: AAC(3)-I family aminoglycoside N-acetyltransferase [Pseudomonadota bacterium]